MKILVVLTGGTIGSSIISDVADVDLSTADELIKICEYSSDIELEISSPFNILSENATTDTLSKLCSYMLSVNYSKYDGVIITHGSDTLAYSCAILGMVLSWIECPVVVTAADYVLSLPYSNGRENFKASVDFIRGFANGEHFNTGVFAVWKNSGELPSVHISTRLEEADGYLDHFTSWGGVPFGEIKDNRFVRIDSRINPPFTKCSKKLEWLKNNQLNLKNNVLLLHSYVGLDFNSINTHGKKAVLLKMYHSSTMCTGGNNNSFIEFIEKLVTADIDIYGFSGKRSAYFYASSQKLLDKSINLLYNINVCSAYSKLLIAYAAPEARRNEIIGTNIFYESLPDRIISPE